MRVQYRAWDKINKEMIPWEWFIDWEPPINTSVNFFDDNLIFMQYTGIKDKNGVEIYEGDVLAVPYGNVAVTWDEEQATYVCGEVDLCEHWAEVIGNIHENPELLEK